MVDAELLDLLRVCKNLPKPSMDDLKPYMVNFGPKQRQKTLILDMDETLIHAKILSSTDTTDDGDFTVGSESMQINVKVRPYFDHCIAHLAQMYEVVIFTAGE